MNRISHARVSPATVFAALATLSVLAPAPAMAGVMTFDNLRPDVYESGQTLNTSSYNLLFLTDPTTAAGGGVSGVGAILDGRAGSSCDIAACPQGASGNYLAILNDGGVNFSRADHRAFTLSGFDYSFIAPITGLPNMNWGQLQLSGTLSNGQVVSTSLAFPGQGSDGNYHFQSASLLSGLRNYAFTGLTFNACIFNDTGACSNSLDFPAFNLGQFALDNINISAVPEPSTCMLMLTGLGAIGMLSRRRAGTFATATVQGA
ncbi:NF038120 family PEP-CTERM protein [Janthinobacterium sp. SUN073]|uniref:NF038120 family PEP-CTERM protein n=1 Tax=Janthinobacterium sp. SUN073 TaxID=3004102 RepID=UPI0025B109F6|nr:NF038120 family PEP-CTERM protein [Janthinobacterium sp. SUN073]MDN2699033.1 NF038120 family PEP-CTERM protein [Janthinobacterium sp. SUN073]